jgi:16S rRNA (cytosine967-C5)-methyltransferase
MASDAPRAMVIATLADHWGLGVEELQTAFGEQYGPGELSSDELARLAEAPGEAPAHVAADWPEWLMAGLEQAFGESAADQAVALAERAPVDLRANSLKADRKKLLKAMAKYGAVETPLSPLGVRLPVPPSDGRNPNVEADPAHARGWFEVQDAGSQVAALMCDAKPGLQVADICAGAGGKTLALAAAMNNKGQIHAHDGDKHRLRPIYERISRAGVRNVQVIAADEPERLDGLAGRIDRVLVDAPCSGSGAWRRRPDAKWRFNKRLLADRLEDQAEVLDRAAPLVKPGGRLVYVTCSILPPENGDQVKAFTERHPQFAPVPHADVWRAAIGTEPPVSADGDTTSLLLTPATHGTDGFYIAVLERL